MVRAIYNDYTELLYCNYFSGSLLHLIVIPSLAAIVSSVFTDCNSIPFTIEVVLFSKDTLKSNHLLGIRHSKL